MNAQFTPSCEGAEPELIIDSQAASTDAKGVSTMQPKFESRFNFDRVV